MQRASREKKPLDEVLHGMRLDWLQGISIGGDTAYFSDDVYDKYSDYDGFFDRFTFDIGKGKGHGHTSTANTG